MSQYPSLKEGYFGLKMNDFSDLPASSRHEDFLCMGQRYRLHK